MLRLQLKDGLLILLSHVARGGSAHKVLPCAAQPISEARLPDSVRLLPPTVASYGPLPDACTTKHNCSEVLTAPHTIAVDKDVTCDGGHISSWYPA